MSGEERVVDAVASALGYRPPTDGLIGSGFEKIVAYNRAADVLKAIGLPLDLPVGVVRRWGAGEVIHLGPSGDDTTYKETP